MVVLIVGDYTARVGDPSGRSTTRPVLAPEQIDANAQTFQEQAMKVLDRERLEVRHNSEWLDMAMEELFALLRTTTVAQLLERDDFAKRFSARQPISVLELLYPLLQGYDSVAVRRRRRARRHRPEVQPAARPGHPARLRRPEQVILTCRCSPGPTASARCRSRLATTSASPSRRTRCTARRSASPTRRSSSGTRCCSDPTRRPGSARGTPSGRSRARSSPGSTASRRLPRPRRSSTASMSATSCQLTCPRSSFRGARTGRSTCRR